MSQTCPNPAIPVSDAPLAEVFARAGSALELQMHRGTRTPLRFGEKPVELRALLKGAGVFDLSYRTLVRVTGRDRVRWLNGMITSAVKNLTPGQFQYSLVLNPQGRIQGDLDVAGFEDFLLLETDRSQSERLLTHLRRFIIMDQVKLEELDVPTTVMGIAGPRAAAVLNTLGLAAPELSAFQSGQIAGTPATVFHEYSPLVPRFTLHVAADQAVAAWEALTAAGAQPCGLEALEDLRVLEGTPAYEVDFSDKNLPQETNLQRALNFTKGCYIGQEIVERIRARATVHRSLRQFELQGDVPVIGPGQKLELRSGDAAAGELTSIAHFDLPGFRRTLALGIARVEALDKAQAGDAPLHYDGGTAVALDAAPSPLLSLES